LQLQAFSLPGFMLYLLNKSNQWAGGTSVEDYRTIRGTATGEYEEKKSRFIAQLSFADSEEKAVAFFIGEVPPKAPKCTGSEISANKCRYSDYNAYLWQPGQSSSYCNFLGNTLSRLSLAGLLHR